MKYLFFGLGLVGLFAVANQSSVAVVTPDNADDGPRDDFEPGGTVILPGTIILPGQGGPWSHSNNPGFTSN